MSNPTPNLRLALAKGKIREDALDLMERCGMDVSELRKGSRKLIFDLPKENLTIIDVRASDVPTYVEYGAADMGIVGKDTLLESGADLYEPTDLKIAPCRMSVCGKVEETPPIGPLKIATKFANIASDTYRRRGQPVEIIKLYGSIELAPLTGLADRIVDLVQTGATLKNNGLEEKEVIMEISSRLVVGRAAMKTKASAIQPFIERLEKAIS